MSRARWAALVAVFVLLAPASAALAHGGNPNYRSVIDRVTPQRARRQLPGPQLRQLHPAARPARPRSDDLRLRGRALRAHPQGRHGPGERALAGDLPQRQPLRRGRRSRRSPTPRRRRSGRRSTTPGPSSGTTTGCTTCRRRPAAAGHRQEQENEDLRLRRSRSGRRQEGRRSTARSSGSARPTPRRPRSSSPASSSSSSAARVVLWVRRRRRGRRRRPERPAGAGEGGLVGAPRSRHALAGLLARWRLLAPGRRARARPARGHEPPSAAPSSSRSPPRSSSASTSRSRATSAPSASMTPTASGSTKATPSTPTAKARGSAST